MGQKLEEERQRIDESMKKNTISVPTQEGRWQGEIGNGQANAYQNFNTVLKREVEAENATPGLSYGEVGQRYFDQGPRDMPKLTKPFGKDTDSMMTERDAAQNQKKGEIPRNYVKGEPKNNEAQQLPNMDPEQNERRDWSKQNWNRADWNAWGYYFGPFTTGYGENIPSMQEKGKGKEENFQGDGQIP